MQAIVGASLLSAAASLPLHLLPLLIASVIAEGRLPLAQAGWIATACMSGILVASIAQPSFGLKRISPMQAVGAIAAVLAGMWASTQAMSPRLMLACWFVIGLGGGVLHFLATTTAAAEKNRESAFSIRLAITLLVSGCVVFVVQHLRGFGTYSLLSVYLFVALAILTSLGWALYTPPMLAQSALSQQANESNQPNELSDRNQAKKPAFRPRHFLGLAIIFGLFLGQQGFWAYAVETVKLRGVDIAHLAYAIAASKIMAAGLLYLNAKRPLTSLLPAKFSLPGIGLACAVLLMAGAQHAFVFMLGVLLWEIALNILSARTQAAVVKNNPQFGGGWLTAAVFLGAALGPALHGLLLQAQLGLIFWLFASLSALLPFAWVSWRAHRHASVRAKNAINANAPAV